MPRSWSRRALLVLLPSLLVAPWPARGSSWDYSWALPEWRATWAAPKLADNRAFAVRATANAVYVAGVTGSHGTGAGDLFLLRYDRGGSLLWERTWGGFELDQAQGIAVDGEDVWVAGSRTEDDGVIEFALLRFSSSGRLLLAKTWRRGVIDALQAIVVRGPAVYVAGLTHPTRADRNAYVAKLSRTGALLWEREIGGTGWDEAWDAGLRSGVLYVAGYLTRPAGDSEAALMRFDAAGSALGTTTWGGPGNDEARALAISGDAIYVTGGQMAGRSTDVFVSKLDANGVLSWTTTTGGAVVGGGGYGIALGERGIYVAGGSYDFPAGGDGAIMRFSRSGTLEWTQLYGLPGFWDWGFDVDVRDDRFYVTGVLWRTGAEWYTVMTAAYREDFPAASLTGVAAMQSDGDFAGAQRALAHFWPGDFLRWARARDSSDAGSSRATWEGASDAGKRYGKVWVELGPDGPAYGEDHAAEALTGLTADVAGGNYAFVRDYTGVTANLFDGFIRLHYEISHDRLIPQGGYVYVGELGIPLPPPPV